MNKTKLFLGLQIIILYIISIFFSSNEFLASGIIINLFSSILMILWVKSVSGNYTNMTIFFVVFSTLYGLSGPISALWGEGLHTLFSKPYQTSPFLLSYSIAHISLILGIMLYNLTCTRKNNFEILNIKIDECLKKKDKIRKIALILAGLASIFELINLFRIGGFGMLFKGKAIFQSAIAGLTMRLPSTELMVVAFSLFGIYLSVVSYTKTKSPSSKINIIIFVLNSFPYLFVKIMLGQRGGILTLFISIFIGITYFEPIKKIKAKLVVLVLIVYVSLGFLYANRAIVHLIPNDPEMFLDMAFEKERLVKALNPGANEFGAAFGNFSEFYNKYQTKFTPKLGSTYIKGLTLLIPSFIYPGDKPQQISYEFRDEFFKSEASRGSIAGTGFSSILESYMNFKYFGVFLIYLLLGYFLQKIDIQYRYKSLYFMILFVSIIPLTVGFHRSAFGTVFGSIVLRALLIWFVMFFIRLPKEINS